MTLVRMKCAPLLRKWNAKKEKKSKSVVTNARDIEGDNDDLTMSMCTIQSLHDFHRELGQ